MKQETVEVEINPEAIACHNQYVLIKKFSDDLQMLKGFPQNGPRGMAATRLVEVICWLRLDLENKGQKIPTGLKF